MSKGIPPVRTWRATFYGFGNHKLGSVTVQAPTKFLARLALNDGLARYPAAFEAYLECSRVTWGAVRGSIVRKGADQ
jgi:hypothetical protein